MNPVQSGVTVGAKIAFAALGIGILVPRVTATALADLSPALVSWIDGPAALSGQFGASVAAIGDFDGDGYPDIAIASPGQANGSTSNAGAVYIIYGDANGFPNAGVDTLLATRVTKSQSALAGAGAAIGSSLVAVGDFDGDGCDDLVVGSALGGFNGNQVGKAWIVRGRRARVSTIDLDSDSATTSLVGVSAGDGFGSIVAGGGDLNGDGRPDVVISAVYANNFAGATYVVHGTTTPPAQIMASTLLGSSGATFADSHTFDLSGISLALGGDVNGDGVDDLVIGALGLQDEMNHDVGGAFLVYGKPGGYGATSVDLRSLPASAGVRILGTYYAASGADAAGSSVAILRDQNGDHLDEIVVADPDASPLGRGLAGAVGVVYGSTQLPAQIRFTDLDGVRGYRLYGAAGGDKFGYDVAVADWNGDGRQALLIDAVQRVDNTTLGTGRVFVHFARAQEIAERDMQPWLVGHGFGEIYTPPQGTVDFGSLRAACRRCLGSTPVVMGSGQENGGHGAAYVVTRSDRIFYDGNEL